MEQQSFSDSKRIYDGLRKGFMAVNQKETTQHYHHCSGANVYC